MDDTQHVPAARVAGHRKHTTREVVEALQNLLFLIREDAGDAYRVNAYVDQADKVLRAVHTGPCCCFERE